MPETGGLKNVERHGRLGARVALGVLAAACGSFDTGRDTDMPAPAPSM